MNTQEPNIQESAPQAIAPIPPLSPLFAFLSRLKEKIPQPVRDILGKFSQSGFYSNKKVFWPVVIAFGLLFLTIVIGMIFGTKTSSIMQKKASPTPFVNLPETSPSVDKLTQSQSKLGDLKDNISNLDFRQSRLKQPTINFDIRF